MMTQMQTQLRWMIRRDMPEVLAIENQCFTSPWPEQEFLNTLKETSVFVPRNRIAGLLD